MTRRMRSALVAVVLIGLFVAGCGGSQGTGELEMAPASQLPNDLKDSPSNVQEAYRFAIANKELLEQIPCFCGCVAGGHQSNYSCYVAEDGGPGTILQYDYHALGWGICVDITRDVMEMLQEGKTVDEMRAVIYDRYGNFGPSTDEAQESSSNGASLMSMNAAEHPSANMLVQRCEEENGSCAQD